MECKFQVNDRVVCINARYYYQEAVDELLQNGFVFPQYGEVYTVREIVHYRFYDFGGWVYDIGVYLKELVNPIFEWEDGEVGELPFVHYRFKPLEFKKRKTEIEVFNKLLIPTKIVERV